MSRYVMAGGSGFLGRSLAEALAGDGHEVVVLTRGLAPGARRHDPGSGRPGVTAVGWAPDDSAGPWAQELEGAAAVVNLAGTSIAGGRWSAAQKTRIRESRLVATRSLVAAISGAAQSPALLVSGSAVGYYGRGGDETLTEAAPAGSDFLAGVCQAWEAEAMRAARPGVRVAIVRTGLVLDRRGGALPRMLPPFKLFAGGPLGSGRQYMSWIHRADWVGLVRWIAATDTASGAFNATAPRPVTNAEFSRELGRVLRRPSWLPAPAFALRLLLGEMADALLLTGQRVLPARAMSLGYAFRFPNLDQALEDIFR
jgi:uncharacterized protein